MFFWFKRKKIVLDCFTSDAMVHERHKIQKATYSLPEWFKGLDSKQANLKHCEGFKRYFKKAITLNMWSTFDFSVDCKEKKWSWAASHPTFLLHQHTPKEYGHFLNINDYDHIKISSPWVFKTNKFINFAWVDSFWCRGSHDYFFPNAVLDFFYQHNTDVNMFFRLSGPSYKFTMQAGEPMIFLLPLTEDNVEVRNHLVSLQELQRYTPLDVGVSQLKKRYFLRKKHTDKLLSQQKKCPFGFGG